MSGRISGSVEGQGMATLGGVSEVCGEEGTVNVWRKSNALKGWGQRDPHVRKPTLGKQSVQLQPVTVAISHPGYPALQQTTNPRLLPQPMKAARPHMRGNRRKNGRHNASLARFRLKQLVQGVCLDRCDAGRETHQQAATGKDPDGTSNSNQLTIRFNVLNSSSSVIVPNQGHHITLLICSVDIVMLLYLQGSLSLHLGDCFSRGQHCASRSSHS
ncbi:hypothetical protein QR685DRAFT_605268 [Neurospora intermedia]|uniref:Uncharacterized protein n=1 Tax=Neurospora intermedia TaxID=5142 RepID=A0ABR3DIF7_NEUIN